MIIKRFMLSFIGTLISTIMLAQTGQEVNILDASTIPEELKAGAYSVKRNEKIVVNISSPEKATIKTTEVITILEERGKGELFFYVTTDKFRTLSDVEIKLYDAKGKLISKHKEKDLSTTISNDGLIEDGKIYYLPLSTTTYPVTIEKYYEINYKGVYKIPAYYIQSPWEAIENSSYTIAFPNDMDIKYKSYNIALNSPKNGNDKGFTYSFSARNLKARKYEGDAGPWTNYFPHVLFNSNKVNLDGNPGDLSSWKEMGLWYNRLAKSVNRLSDAHQKEIKALVANITDDREKVRALYNHLQKNFRYVSIQLGIGGFKPFAADFVHEKKYGDCKGLSNYMEACLSAINIKSYSAWINAGNDQPAVDPTFPYDGFNHQILCVILPKDSIWLECTSNYNEFGHLSNFTENRNAVLMTEKGGVLVSTPLSKPDQNVFRMKTAVVLNDDGSGQITSTLLTSGDYKYDRVRLAKEKEEYQKREMVNLLGFSNPDEYSIKYGSAAVNPFMTEFTLASEKIPDFTAGPKMFIRPRMYKFWAVKMPAFEKRTQDYLFDCPLKKIDTTVFNLPQGFSVDALPGSKKLAFEFGTFESKYWIDEQSKQVYSTASLVLTQYRIPAEKYAATKAFMDKILEDENQKLVIRKQ
jgi:hypothetical protein